jgi:hypothetical protein
MFSAGRGIFAAVPVKTTPPPRTWRGGGRADRKPYWQSVTVTSSRNQPVLTFEQSVMVVKPMRTD